jgi:hypothetical protein
MPLPAIHLQALRLIAQKIGASSIDWAVTGSAGMALQGAPFEVHDLDIQTDRAGAYQLAGLLAGCAVTPVRYLVSEQIRSHLGEYELAGVKVEIMGAIEKLVAGVWEQPVDVKAHRRWVEHKGLALPVLDLEYECQAYLKMGRLEKAAKLRAWLARVT